MNEIAFQAVGIIGRIACRGTLDVSGYNIFTELGDLSRVDLIALVDQEPVKIQVKTRNLKDGKIVVDSRKSGPGYLYRYQPGDVDVFAIYVPEVDLVLFLSIDFVLKAKGATAIRIVQAKNNQRDGIHWFEDYLDFKRALRDHTQSTRTG
ncbi:MAG: hypothetical protein EYC68_04970 [Chloroflexota bacterium]|nr:MAG: hypothetical protein EYC68_04970 [Chloroflexota bacterium]